MAVLVIAEHDNSVLKTSTFNTITAATNLSDDIHLLIIGKDIETLSNNAKSIYKSISILYWCYITISSIFFISDWFRPNDYWWFKYLFFKI